MSGQPPSCKGALLFLSLVSLVVGQEEEECGENVSFQGLVFLCRRPRSQFVVCVLVAGMIIKRKSGEIPCPLAVEAFAAHLSYICKYDDKYSKYVTLTIPSL